MIGRAFRAALAILGVVYDSLIPPRIEDRSRAHLESRGDGPGAVSAEPRPPAPASGHPDMMETGQDHPCSVAAEFFPLHTQTSAVPPAAADGPGPSSPLGPGSPADDWAELPRTYHDDPDEFHWVRWVIPAISSVLTNHRPIRLFPGGPIFCTRADESPCSECPDWEGWVSHVAPNVAVQIHSEAAKQPAPERCQHCQQPIELWTDVTSINGVTGQKVGMFLHRATGRHECVEIPGYARTYASPEK